MITEKWHVGDEYDEVTSDRMRRALGYLQYGTLDGWSGIAGSQSIQQWMLVGPKGRLVLEIETYVGLSLEGPPSLIAELKAQYEQAI